MFFLDPVPFLAGIWARIAEIGTMIVFFAMTFTAAILFDELISRANEMKEINSNSLPMALKEWRRIYDLVCEFVENINDCFGPTLLLQTALYFALPIFDFNKILVPSYLVTEKVWPTI